MARDVKARLWAFVFYLEDWDDEAWKGVIDEWHVPCLVSPLHTDGGGKAHYHGLMVLDGPIAHTAALEMVSTLGCKHVEKVASRMSYERYLCHLDSPDKPKYDPAEIVCFGGAYPKFCVDEEYRDGFVQITKLIEQFGITVFADLNSMIAFDYPELLTCLARYSGHFYSVCRSRFDLARYGDNNTYVKSRRGFGYFFDKEV